MNKTFDEMCNALSKTSLSVPDRMIAVNAILDRFEVTPKPPITDEALGMTMARVIAFGRNAPRFDEAGRMFAVELEKGGLKIVKVDE